jgi:hypothetical protein
MYGTLCSVVGSGSIVQATLWPIAEVKTAFNIGINYEELSLFGYRAAFPVENQPTFWKSIFAPLSQSRNKLV